MRRWPLRAALAAILGCLLAFAVAALVVTTASSAEKPVNAPLFTYGSQ
jgi:hypothetical protein